MSVKWTLTDPIIGDNYTFAINPGDHDTETYEKNLQFEATVVPGAMPLLFEGQDTPTTMEVAGTLLAQSQWQTLISWFDRRHQVQLIDDRGYARWIYIYKLEGTRKPSALYPWRTDWTLTAYVMSATFPV